MKNLLWIASSVQDTTINNDKSYDNSNNLIYVGIPVVLIVLVAFVVYRFMLNGKAKTGK